MDVKMYGTRGSTPISGVNSVRYGGNTTCVRVSSPCLPPDHWLLIDAGTGIVPASWDFGAAKGKALTIFQTHWHHDHTQGFALSAFPYVKSIPVAIYGPLEDGIGPREAYRTIMHHPLFPVDFDEVASHIRCYGIEHPNSSVILIHPVGGVHRLILDDFERLTQEGRQMPFGGRMKFPVGECMVVRLHKSHHPERTISYRFEERPTGKTFVFLTDHENQNGIPVGLRAHLQDADVLVMDCQYTDEKYDTLTAGWGHSTPRYAARLARETGVKLLGLTHHDPPSSDELVDQIEETAARYLREAGSNIGVFACNDYIEFAV